MAEKNSLWKNIRNKAKQNKRTGATPKKPSAQMLRQEAKINSEYADGGYMYGEDPFKSKENQGSTVGKPAQEWLTSWVQDPEFALRLNQNFPAKATDLDKRIFGDKEARQRASSANLRSIENRIPDLVEDINKTNFLYNENPTINQNLVSSYKNSLKNPTSIKYLESQMKSNPQGFTDSEGNIIINNPSGYSPQSISAHELIHKTGITTNKGSETLDKMMKGKFQRPAEDRIDANYDKDEMYPFLMQMRMDNQFQPGEEITPERLKQIRESGPKNHLFKYYDDDQISKYLNTLASNQTQAPIQYASRGGYMYPDGVGEDGKPVTLYKKAEYNSNTDKILEYAGSEDNKYYVTPNTPQGIDFESRLPEFEIIQDTGLYNPDTSGYTAPRFIPSETGLISNPNYHPLATGALDPVYPEAVLLPGNLPIKATSTLGKIGVGLLETAVDNPGFGLGSMIKNSSVKNILKAQKDKILKTAKDAKIAVDEFVVTPIQFRKEIAELKKLKNDYSSIFNTEEGKKRLDLLGIDPSKISDFNLKFKPNEGSYYATGYDDFINEMNIDFRQLQRLKKEGQMLSPKSIFEHEMGHLLQKESYKQKGILKDLDIYNKDLIEHNKIRDRILNNPYLTSIQKSIKLQIHKANEPVKPFITTKPTLIDKGAKQLTRNNSVIDDQKIAASNVLGSDILSFPEKSYSYFNHGSDVERFAHLREMRQNMIESGVIKNMYDPITNEDLLKFITNNPGDRVSSFVDASPNNIEWLKTLLNSMPAAVPAVGIGVGIGVGALQQDSQPQQQAQGGYTNPYMYYSGGPMEYGNGGRVLKHIGAGAYALGEGLLDTVTGGATDQITDKGFEWLTKIANKNMDLSNPRTAKFYKTQQQIKGYTNTAAAVGAGIVTGNVQGAVQQGTKGLNTAFQASDWASDDFKKWSGISSKAIGIGAGLAGGSLNTEGASKGASEAAAKVGEIGGKVSPYVNQAVSMFGSKQQPMWQQAQAQQDYLNSPEYKTQQSLNNQQYVNQGLSFGKGGYIYPDGGDLKGNTKVYTNPKEFKKAKQAYNDSLYLSSNSITFPTDIYDSYFRTIDLPYQQETYVNNVIPITGVEVNNKWTNTLNTRIKPTSFEPARNTIHSYPMTRAKYPKPKVEPILEERNLRPNIDNIQSKDYSNPSENIDIVGTPVAMPPIADMDASPEGHYRVTRVSPYADPYYQIWEAGNKWRDVSPEEFDKINQEKYLTEYKSTGGNITNNSLNLQPMKDRYRTYKQRMSKGGTFNQYGIDIIPDSAGLHHESAYGGVPIGPNALAEGGEIKMDTPDGGQYIVSDQVDGTESQMDFTFSKGGKYKELNRTLAEGMKQDLSKYSMGSLATNSNSKEDVRRPMDSYSKSTIDQIKQKWQQKTEFARQRSQQEQAIAQAEEQKRLIEEEYIAAYGGRINPKKYPGLNMPKRSKGGYVYNPMTQPMLAHGGPLVSNVQQPFNGPAAQNRGGMMVEYGRGGNMYAMGGPDGIPGFDLTGDEYNNFLNQVDDSELTMDPTTNAVKNFNRDTLKNIQSKSLQNQYIRNPKYSIPEMEITGSIESMPEIVKNINNSSSYTGAGTGTPKILYAPENPTQYTTTGENNFNLEDPFASQNTKEINLPDSNSFTQGIIPIDIQNIVSNQTSNNNSGSTTPWYDEPAYSKIARYLPLATSAAGIATGLKNKKRTLTPERISPEQINLERSRITSMEEGRRALDSGLRNVRGSSSNTGQLSANTRDMILNYNKNMGANIAKSYETEENTNAQLRQQSSLANQQYGNQFKQLNEEMFQNAQTMALRAAQEGAVLTQGAAEQERKQYLQEWIAKNRLKTRNMVTGPDGEDYYYNPITKKYNNLNTGEQFDSLT